jgi:hypothetical protein
MVSLGPGILVYPLWCSDEPQDEETIHQMRHRRQDPVEAHAEVQSALKALEAFVLNAPALDDERIAAAAGLASPSELREWIRQADNVMLVATSIRLRLREHLERLREEDDST